jgi:hypothetical protein
MKSSKIFIAAVCVAVAALVTTAFIKKGKAGKVNESAGFAVVELFTSEGCSSCPPADALVAKIQNEMKGKPVYILAYHVDYWNSLGWKDVFSSPDFSKRQRDYARYLHLQSIYTPQIVVNGETEFVGSEEGTLRSTIKSNLQTKTVTTVALNAESITAGKANLKYTISGADKKTVLLVAIVQKNAQTNVERGENGGRKLSHVQIVNKLQSVPLTGVSGTVTVDLPNGFDMQAWEITGFLQNTGNGQVIAASRATFPDEKTAGTVESSQQ